MFTVQYFLNIFCWLIYSFFTESLIDWLVTYCNYDAHNDLFHYLCNMNSKVFGKSFQVCSTLFLLNFTMEDNGNALTS